MEHSPLSIALQFQELPETIVLSYLGVDALDEKYGVLTQAQREFITNNHGKTLVNKGNIKRYVFGVHHCWDGPAVELSNGEKFWYIAGIRKRGKFHNRTEWYSCNDIIHRDNAPAIVFEDGDIHWYQHGKLHRLDGPAIECVNGENKWFQHGKLHNLNSPARISNQGTEWYFNGNLHRLDGPAIERTNGDKYWFFGGYRHRVGGPAIDRTNGEKHWFLHGIEYYVEYDGIKMWVHSTNKYGVNDADYNSFPIRHRPESEGPAVIYPNGDKEWYKYGKLHRENGPAVELANGEKKWYQNGELHRFNGPARVRDGFVEWYQYGRLHRLDGPAVISDRHQVWYNTGRKHRLDGPADISEEGSFWFRNGYPV